MAGFAMAPNYSQKFYQKWKWFEIGLTTWLNYKLIRLRFGPSWFKDKTNVQELRLEQTTKFWSECLLQQKLTALSSSVGVLLSFNFRWKTNYHDLNYRSLIPSKVNFEFVKKKEVVKIRTVKRRNTNRSRLWASSSREPQSQRVTTKAKSLFTAQGLMK